MPPRPRCRLAAARGALLATLAVFLAAAGSADAQECPYPLGTPVESGNTAVLGGGDDPEYQIIDATNVFGGNQVQGIMLSAGGELAMVQEMKVEPPDTDMIMLRWFEQEKGWNGTRYYLSSPDPMETMPESPPNDVAFHSRVSSTVWRDEVWSIWEAWHSVYNPVNQALLLRGASPDALTPILVVTTGQDANDSVKYGSIAPAGDRLMVVYAEKVWASEPAEFNLVWSLFDGANFTPKAALSRPSDDWSEALSLLVVDGARIYAVWLAEDLHSFMYELRYAAFDGAAWSEPRTIVEAGFAMPSFFWPAVFDGSLQVVYDTNDPYVVNGRDLEIALMSVNLTTGALMGPVLVNPQPSDADDSRPTAYAAAGRLWIGWSTMDPLYSHHGAKNETDAVFRTFDGTVFGPVIELSEPNDTATDDFPNFVADETSVYAYWILGEFPPPPGLKHDWRQAVQLVERSSAPFAGVEASVGLEVPAANGTVRLWASVSDQDAPSGGAPMLQLADGSFVPLERAGEKWTALLEAADLEAGPPLVALCGKAVATTRDDSVVPGSAAPSPTAPTGAGLFVAPLLAVAAAATVALWLRGRR